MKTLIYEIGVVDILDNKHPVRFKEGLNVVTGKSSTGKSALIEIFDYCFGSRENTIPKGVITTSAAIYYVALSVNDQDMIIARDPDLPTRAFFRRVQTFDSNEIQRKYFENSYFRRLDDFKKHLRSFFLDIDDVDTSLEARSYRNGRKSATPSIRSLTSFILQHQNLIANKHALFYRFDEKEKRDQVIDHTKIFLGLVDQNYFLLSQEKERISGEIKKLVRQRETNVRASKSHQQKIGPILNQLYAMMGFKREPISLNSVLRDPLGTIDELDRVIIPENINHNSNAVTQRYDQLKKVLAAKTGDLRKLQRKEKSIKKHIEEEVRFVENMRDFKPPENALISSSVCPFCLSQKEELVGSAEKLRQAIVKVSSNLAQARPIKAKFESSLMEVKRTIEEHNQEVSNLVRQISKIEQQNKQLSKQKSLYENILLEKSRLVVLLETINLADDVELDKSIKNLEAELKAINKSLKQYNVQQGLKNAAREVNEYMNDIGSRFEFERSYRPIKLHFSFETFDLYHQPPEGERIYLRSMGSGANWLYSHVTLFLALQKYFTKLGEKCSVPSILFLDQPTQVYFPNFNRDNSDSFQEQKDREIEDRKKSDIDRVVDEDIKAVENLFSRLSIYCDEITMDYGFCPQIIVTDHADDLTLADGSSFEGLVNGNRWRKRGLIDPLP